MHYCQFCHRTTAAELEMVFGLASAQACPECAAQLRAELRTITACTLLRFLAEKSQAAAQN